MNKTLRLRGLLLGLIWLLLAQPATAQITPRFVALHHAPAAVAAAPSQTTVWDLTADNAACSGCATHSTTNVANDTIAWASGTPTSIATVTNLPSAAPLLVYWEYKLLAVSGLETRLGVTATANAAYIGGFGADPSTRAMRMDGTFEAASGTIPTQQTITTLAAGAIIGIYWNKTTKQMWWTPDNVNFWGAGGATVNTASDVIATTGGWTATSEDARTRGAGVSLLAAGNSVQLLAGSNITRTPLTGYTVLP
jgi:hypothetical protein